MSFPRLFAALLASAMFPACTSPDATSTIEEESVISGGPYFEIHALGDRCVDAARVNADGVGNLVIRQCTGVTTQVFKFIELDTTTHDLDVQAYGTTRCIAMDGAATTPHQLTLRPCTYAATQRLAWDGDALLGGTQLGPTERVARDLALEVLDGDTRSETPVVLGHRDVSDAEYWWLKPVGNALHPHSGFIKVTNETEFYSALHDAGWGTVIEATPTTTDDIALPTYPMNQVLKAGVTLRGNRKRLFNGTRLVVPHDTPVGPDHYIVRLEDHARVTGLRIEGNETGGGSDGVWGLLLGNLTANPPADAPNAIVDHVDMSHWSGASITVWGAHEADPTGNGDYRFTCASEPDRSEPRAKIIGNFLHHSIRYGVLVDVGTSALVSGNLMFLNTHDVTSSFHTQNRYYAYDNLFTGEVNDDSSAVFDLHGSCSSGYWDGGRAGDQFDVGWNSFLTSRKPTFSIRGTPCDHAEFHDNVSTQSGDYEHVKVNTDISRDVENDCFYANGDPFVPGLHENILWQYGNLQSINRFEVKNPLLSCPRRNGMTANSCDAGDIAVGDFDNDGIDDLFFGSGATWWYSSGGTAEWRFLNRKTDLASDLRFGDLDADGRTDVIAFNGRDFEVSWAGTSPWFPLNFITEEGFTKLHIDDIAVGQFDNRTGADLFISNGTSWRYSSRGSGTWTRFGGFALRTSKLRFGDFDDDGRTDVFAVVGGQWRIWNGLLNHAVTLGTAYVTDINALVVAGFGDTGKADVAFSSGNGEWKVSPGGTSAPVTYSYSAQPLAALPIGQFDGVDGADVLRWDDRWLRIVSSAVVDKPWSRQSMR